MYCQKGLCAYSEKELCNPKFITLENWNKDKYKRELSREEKGSIKGDLEHFDESLKSKKAWLWENLFIVDTHINCRIKGQKSIKSILKPDSPNYDPYKYLDFDFETGRFIPNMSLSQQEIEDVLYMITTLGLNCYASERKKQLENFIELKELGSKRKPHEYITAWRMTLKLLEENKK
ncbi:hypothetical protein MNB_SV-12-15 [hydrothermal vent metagenome]|uniref:Uncharacterized protein n=1 Tax=hydrothermal vent metagenome TaxID=652676 RepID=A0A1W1BAR4_9ZZZZ